MQKRWDWLVNAAYLNQVHGNNSLLYERPTDLQKDVFRTMYKERYKLGLDEPPPDTPSQYYLPASPPAMSLTASAAAAASSHSMKVDKDAQVKGPIQENPPPPAVAPPPKPKPRMLDLANWAQRTRLAEWRRLPAPPAPRGVPSEELTTALEAWDHHVGTPAKQLLTTLTTNHLAARNYCSSERQRTLNFWETAESRDTTLATVMHHVVLTKDVSEFIDMDDSAFDQGLARHVVNLYEQGNLPNAFTPPPIMVQPTEFQDGEMPGDPPALPAEAAPGTLAGPAAPGGASSSDAARAELKRLIGQSSPAAGSAPRHPRGRPRRRHLPFASPPRVTRRPWMTTACAPLNPASSACA